MKLTIFAIIAITWASLTSIFPEVPYVTDVPFYDKWAHFVMYGTLSLVVQWDCRRMVLSRVRQILAFFLFPSFWGIMMEVAQDTLTTWRSGDPVDALANTVGAALGTALGLTFMHLKNK